MTQVINYKDCELNINLCIDNMIDVENLSDNINLNNFNFYNNEDDKNDLSVILATFGWCNNEIINKDNKDNLIKYNIYCEICGRETKLIRYKSNYLNSLTNNKSYCPWINITESSQISTTKEVQFNSSSNSVSNNCDWLLNSSSIYNSTS